VKRVKSLKSHLDHFLIVSIAFIVTNALTLGFVIPVQGLLSQYAVPEIGLLFLPHGIRVIAFHYLGWKAILHMLPASYLFLVLSNNSGAELDVLSPIVSMVACYIGFLGATVVVQKENIGNTISTWKYFVIAGATSSVGNGVALSWLQFADTPLSALIGYVVGDTLGLVVCLVVLMYSFRLIRLSNELDQ
jgi:hypothetical protein